MRNTVLAMLLMGCSLQAWAENCVDIVSVQPGAAPEEILGNASKRRANALREMQARTSRLTGGKAAPSPRSQAQRVAEVHRDNLRGLEAVEREHLLAKLLTTGDSCRLAAAQAAFDQALGETRFTAEMASQYSAQYGLYVGPNFSLGGAGDWRPGAETLARFDTEVFTEQDPGYEWLKTLVPDSGWLRGYSEISYQSINALEEAEDAGSEPAPADNVFASAGGYFRLNTGLQLHFTNWYGLQLGGGLSSLPNSDTLTRMEPRVFGGLHFQTLYRDGALAQFFVGAAYDKFWQREVFDDPSDPLGGTHVEENFGRYNIDGLIFLPGQAGNFHLAGRLFADAPINGEGPSDLRVSILVYYDFNEWLNTFVPIRSATSVAESVRSSGL